MKHNGRSSKRKRPQSQPTDATLLGDGDEEREENDNRTGEEDPSTFGDTSDTEGGTVANAKACPHVALVNVDGVRATLLDPSNWSCTECNHTESCWACLSCGYVGCGRYQEAHALAHYEATRHPLVFEINFKYCHCYECDAYLQNDNKRGDLEALRVMVEQLQTHTISESRTRSGRLLKSSSHVKLHPRDHTSDDRISTAVKHWQLYTIRRAFGQWRWFVDAWKRGGTCVDGPRAPGFSIFVPTTGSPSADQSEAAAPAGDAWEFREENGLDDAEEDHILLLDGANGSHKASAQMEEAREAATPGNLEEGAGNSSYPDTMPPGVVRTPSGILKRSGTTRSIRRARVSWKTYEHPGNDIISKTDQEALGIEESTHVEEEGRNHSVESGLTRKRKHGEEDDRDGNRKNREGGTEYSSEDVQSDKRTNSHEHTDKRASELKENNGTKYLRRAKRRKGMLADLDMDGPAPRRNLVPGQTGLRNLGNTCFMNAVLQALSNTLQFRNYFVVEFLPKDKKGKMWRRKTVDCLKQITAQQPPALGEIWAVVTPFALLDALWKFVPRFRNYQQQDAQEFLVYLLDKLHDELTSLQGGPSLHGSKKSESIISQTFRGELSSQVICCACGNVSIKREPYLDLSLDIPIQHASRSRTGRAKANKDVPSCDLYDCFDSFTRAEELTGYFCEKCKSRQDATKRFIIQSLPDVLCIVLKRFCWTSTTRAKVDTKVVFPLTGLDLTAFSCEERDDAIFDLQSVVIHHGSGPSAGHYTAFCFHTEQDTWLHFNDSKVSVSSAHEVSSAQAYLLFYQRRGVKNSKFSLPSFIPAPDTLSTETEEEDAARKEGRRSKRKRTIRGDDCRTSNHVQNGGHSEGSEGYQAGIKNDCTGWKRCRTERREEQESEDDEKDEEHEDDDGREENGEDQAEDDEPEMDLDSLLRDELKVELRKRGLKTGGPKAELLRRLKAAVATEREEETVGHSRRRPSDDDEESDDEEETTSTSWSARNPPETKRIAKRMHQLRD